MNEFTVAFRQRYTDLVAAVVYDTHALFTEVLNEPGKWDEIGAFLGASYFRLLGKGQRYGGNMPAALNQILGGWGLQGLYTYMSGEPFSVYSGVRTIDPALREPAFIQHALLGAHDRIEFLPIVEEVLRDIVGGIVCGMSRGPYTNDRAGASITRPPTQNVSSPSMT